METEHNENEQPKAEEKQSPETVEAKIKLSSMIWDVIAFAIVVGLFEISWNNGIASLFSRLPRMNYSQATFVMAFLYIFSRFTFTKGIFSNKE